MAVKPDPYFEPYHPSIYRGLTITDERDGFYRIYDGREQLGWATSKEEAHQLVDELLRNTRNGN